MSTPRYLQEDIGGLSAPHKELAGNEARSRIPALGRTWNEVRDELVAKKKDDYDWRSGRLPIYVYYSDDELLSVARGAYNLYFGENALGRNAFPSVARMEDEVVLMSLDLFHAPAGAQGSFTSGGTESIFLALKSARDRFRELHPAAGRPQIVIPRTAHPAFDKAAHYLDVQVVRIDTTSQLRSDVERMESAINDRTMLIAGSAPCYPYGVYDQITRLGELALARDVWLHVDACLGGFLAPFALEEGYAIPAFDFSLPGVSSLSADIHKFGFSARGASVVLYRNAALKAYQGFRFEDWPRGTYSTETFQGSRPGGTIASAWGVMQFLGGAGYRRLARKTMDAACRLRAAITKIPELEVISPSELNIVLYRSIDPLVDIHAIADHLAERGWFIGRTRAPEALHLALNTAHAPIIGQYSADLAEAVRQVRSTRRVGKRGEVAY